MRQELLTVAELAGFMRVSLSTAYGLVHRAGFPAIRVGRQIRIPRDRLLTWVHERGGLSRPPRTTVSGTAPQTGARPVRPA